MDLNLEGFTSVRRAMQITNNYYRVRTETYLSAIEGDEYRNPFLFNIILKICLILLKIYNISHRTYTKDTSWIM